MKIFDIQGNKICRLVVALLFISSCASNKDIYRNPYQTEIKPAAISSSVYDIQPGLNQQPDWIYAVSKDFIVGYGFGKDIMEAKNAALNDIKAFIVKSLGETGNVVEVNFVQNSVTGRNKVESQESYLMKNQFESKFKPVINVSVDRFEDYYYEKAAYSSKYFIKYKIDAAELNRIKNDYHSSIQKNNLLKSKIHHVVDSLINFPGNPDLESVVERYNAISDFLITANLDGRDSLLIIRGLQNIRTFLNTMEIRILEHDPGKYIRFGLFNGQIPVRSRLEPGIRSFGIEIDTLIQNNDAWELRYKAKENLNSSGTVEIYYDLPSSGLTSKVIVPKPSTKPIFEIADKIQMSDFQKNAWNGNLKSLDIRMNINYNYDKECTITAIEILLHTVGDIYPGITADNINFSVTPGTNFLAKTITSDLPGRFFITRDMECDLLFYYRSGNSLEKHQLKNVPVTIKK